MPSRPRILTTVLIVLLAGCSDPGSTGIAGPDENLFAAADGACALGATDEEALDLIAGLLAEIDALEASGALNAGQAKALRNHLETVRRQIEAGRFCPALAQLDAFLDQVADLVALGVLTEEEAAPLGAGVEDIIEGPSEFPYQVVVDAGSAAGEYEAVGATFGPAPDFPGTAGSLEIVYDGGDGGDQFGTATDACDPLIGFTAGAIAVADRGACAFAEKAFNAQAAGAVALIVVNNNAGALFLMGGSDPTITIPTVMILQADGAAIKAGLPATGAVRSRP